MKGKSGYLKWGLTIFLTVCAILVFYDTFYMSGALQRLLSKLASILSPVLVGLVMAYLLAPIVNWFEKLILSGLHRIKGLEGKTIPHAAGWLRAVSILLTWAIVLLLLYLMFSVVIPQLVDIALGGHEKGHEKRANRGQQVRAGGQQPDDDAPQGRHAIDRLTGGHERRRHGQKNREIGPAHPKALGSPAEPGKKCIQSPAHPGPKACRQIKRRHPHSTLRSFTAETTFLDTWKIFFHHPGPAHPFLSGAGPKNLTLGTLYHKKFEGFVNFWAHSLQAAAWYPGIVYFITFRAVCQVVNSTFSSE